ncbi:MAG TPA: peptidoglycan DD-metalloendopeptidase family protein, partial [Flavobacteriales bacterium]|nr:peptidoglycan DD-metalloendopeptidase family protein [Flavobacteriales bacterium]
MKRWVKWSLGLTVLGAAGFVFIGVDLRPHVEYVPEPMVVSEPLPLPAPSAYGIPMSGYTLREGSVKSGATFGDLLASQGVPSSIVTALVTHSNGLFDVRKLRAGYPFAFIFPDDGSTVPSYFVYESDPVEYVVFDLRQDSLGVTVGQRPVELTEHGITCTITGALYNDIANAGADPSLAVMLSEVFAWTVDFYRIQKGDVFSVVYSERTVEGERVGMPHILAARYVSAGKVLEAFGFDKGTQARYFDAAGNSLRKAFLKAPLKFSRISSGFSARRLHPVQKVFKAHLGTDYAAAYGTPILAVGDGVVEQASRTAGNGNFVKIRHNGTYSTQYLHMRKILVSNGQRVAQGDVIGEVGSTGLATGPHVCFRFWKNGVQVDPKKEVFPSAEPIAEAERPAFVLRRDSLLKQLDDAELASAGG